MFLDDVRSAVRSLSRAKVLTTALLVSLGIGTGANAAVYGAIDALLFRAAAGVEDADRLASVYTTQYDGGPYGASSMPDALAIGALPSVAKVAIVDDRLIANVMLPGSQRSTRVSRVSGDFFQALGMRAHRGRLLDAADQSADPVPAVISASLWEEAGRPESPEKLTVVIGNATHRVVGIAPDKFRGLQAGRLSDVWLPLPADVEFPRGDRRFSVIARLAGERAVSHLQADLDLLASRLADEFPATNRGTQADPEAPRKLTATTYAPTHPSAREHTSMIALMVMIGVGSLLLGACVNAGALLLSRGFARMRELAVKMALGAGRRRLMRQLMLESVLASVGGGVVGLVFAYWTLEAVPAMLSPDHAALLDTRLQIGAVLATLAGTTVAGVLFGVAPAIYATTAPAATALRADTGSISQAGNGSRLRAVLVGSQIALSTALLLSAGLVLAAFSAAQNTDASFPARNVIVVRVENTGRLGDAMSGIGYQQRLAKTLAADGVDAVGWSSAMAAAASGVPSKDFRIAAGAAGLTETAELAVHVVSPGYFDALGLKLVEGRPFDANDRPLSIPVVILEEAFARRYFGAVAVGQHLVDPEGERLRIVGVVRQRRFRTLQDTPRPVVFYPFTQNYPTRGFLFLHTTGDPEKLMDTLREKIDAVDPHAAVERIATLEERLSEALALERMAGTLIGTCGVLALLMAMMGAYGVMNDAVQRRTREIGLRVALGAARRQVVRLVLAEIAQLAVGGFVAGTLIVLGAAQLLRSTTGAPISVDVLTVVLPPVALAVLIGLASVTPLRRALSVSAAIALRAE